jgi:nucleotide sugar dehydrogenase
MVMKAYSVSPSGERFSLPQEKHYGAEQDRLEELVNEAQRGGREVVAVVGAGYVGSVMAAVIADAVDEGGQPAKLVLAYQRPSERSYWKVPVLNRGESPVRADDPEVARLTARCVRDTRALTATYHPAALEMADCVVVDVQCDYLKPELGNMRSGRADVRALEEALALIGERIPAKCLVLIETTVPPGTTEKLAWPILKRAFAGRGMSTVPLLAHSFERGSPGPNFVESIRGSMRVCAGCTREAGERAEKFLSQVLDTAKAPLTMLERPIEVETVKIVENSYRASLLAFMHEWSVFAERAGVDMLKIIDIIRQRPSHDNMLFPGPGVGGYCLPTDSGLGVWGYRQLLGWHDGEEVFRLTPSIVDVNDTRALHAVDLVCDTMERIGHYVGGATITLCGAAYRAGVGDTRFSGSELIARGLAERGAHLRVHDPYVEHWRELEEQDSFPAHGQSRKRFFERQDGLSALRVQHDLAAALEGSEAIVFAVPHDPYRALRPDQVREWAGGPLAVVDCYGVLTDDQIRHYFQLGCEVTAMGRGHLDRIRQEVRRPQ